MIYPKLSKLSLSFRNHIYWIIIKLYDNVCGYNILPKFVNQLIALSIQIIQIDSRHLLSYYMPISLVYYYTGVFCDIWTLLFIACVTLNNNKIASIQWYYGLDRSNEPQIMRKLNLFFPLKRFDG